jgi:hypothetical protein
MSAAYLLALTLAASPLPFAARLRTLVTIVTVVYYIDDVIDE